MSPKTIRKLARESRERRELMEQLEDPIINGDNQDEVI